MSNTYQDIQDLINATNALLATLNQQQLTLAGWVTNASNASVSAQQSATSASTSASTASTASSSAQSSATAAMASANNASLSASSASSSATTAIQYATAYQITSYASLRLYTGLVTSVFVTGFSQSISPSGVSGFFVYDQTDTTTPDNGGTVIVDGLNRRWKRQFSGPIDVRWFGADPTGINDSTTAFLSAISTNYSVIKAPAGTYLISGSLRLGNKQRLVGDSYDVSIINWRPVTDVVCIRNASGARYNGVSDIQINSQSAVLYACQFTSSYENFVKNVKLSGTWMIGVLLHDTYVCNVEFLNTDGANFQNYIVAISDLSNAHTIRNLYTSGYPTNTSVPMVGIGIDGGNSHTVDTPVLQGMTIGIQMRKQPKNCTIINPYFENTLCCMKTGDVGYTQNNVGATIIGGIWSYPYSYHPQYSSAGPMIYMPYTDAITLLNVNLQATGNSSSATGPWPILTTATTNKITITSITHYLSTARAAVMRESAGSSPSISITGSTYGTYGGQELILKNDGNYGGNCYGIQVSSSGILSTVAYQPSLITGTVSTLLTTTTPLISSYVVA